MSTQDSSRPENVALGITLIVATAFLISSQDVVFKLLSDNLTLWQIFSLRGIIAVSIMIVAFRARGVLATTMRQAFGTWPMLRAALITTTLLAFYAALPFLSLSTVGAAVYVTPIFVAMVSAYVAHEPVGPLGWLGVLLGFAGVVIMLQPGTDAFSFWSILPLFGAATYAVAHLITRAKCQDVPVAALGFSQNFAMMFAGVVISLILLWQRPGGSIASEYPYTLGQWASVGPGEMGILFLMACVLILISLLLSAAYQAARTSIVATFEYSYLIFVTIWDIVFFGIAPTFTSVTGMLLIVTAGLLVLRGK